MGLTQVRWLRQTREFFHDLTLIAQPTYPEARSRHLACTVSGELFRLSDAHLAALGYVKRSSGTNDYPDHPNLDAALQLCAGEWEQSRRSGQSRTWGKTRAILIRWGARDPVLAKAMERAGMSGELSVS